jgi:heme oxygenase (biliverdin-IX-beta and delta-forming)
MDMSAIALLRQATWHCHLRLEKRLDVKQRFSSMHLYRTHLEYMWGFYAPLERQFDARIFADALPDHESRRKLPLLASDLNALGVSSQTLPECQAIPAFADTAAAFGCAYVLEGATLGGRTLLSMVRTQLGFTPDHGARFLASYGERAAAMWCTFGTALDAWCATDASRLAASSAAVKTFEALEVWLCGRSA